MAVNDDRAEVERVAGDYIDSWFAGDPERMRNSLSPDLAKRSVEETEDGRPVLESLGASEMVEATAAGRGTRHPRRHEVAVLDLDGDIAAVKVTSAPYVEYLQLARFGGRWLIVNVLWRSQAGYVPPV